MIDPLVKRERDAIYLEALEYAKADYDELYPQLQKLQQRVSWIRNLINSLASLLEVEIDDKYTWDYLITQAKKTRANRKNKEER